MDTLYISSTAREYLLQYCDEELLNYVFADFLKTGKIVEKEEGDEPYRLWIITDYIKRNDIDVRKKLAVILSMASSGFVQVGETKVFGGVPLMLLLHKLGYLSDEDDFYFRLFCQSQYSCTRIRRKIHYVNLPMGNAFAYR